MAGAQGGSGLKPGSKPKPKVGPAQELWRTRWSVAEREEEEIGNSCLFSSYTHPLPTVSPIPAAYRSPLDISQGHARP